MPADASGIMPADATPTVINHEIGHLIGLGDDRTDDGNALPTREKTLMVGGAKLPDGTFTNANSKLKIDKQLVDRIGDQLANLGKITCGQAWNGTLNGTGENRGIATCPDPSSHTGTFTMTVKPGGKATLSGHIVNTSVCVGGFTTEADFSLEGKKTRSAISFPASGTFPFDVNLQVRGDRATGTSTANPGGDGVYFVTLNFTADCQTCDEDVG
jgi:hypothetical protein